MTDEVVWVKRAKRIRGGREGWRIGDGKYTIIIMKQFKKKDGVGRQRRRD